jgi:aminopeptidase N
VVQTYAYSNAEQDDLWQAFDEEARRKERLPRSLTVKTVMDTWTKQKGYPVLTIRFLCLNIKMLKGQYHQHSVSC